ncbi:MAG: hypothetical protein K6F99_02790 [Lachnospiraceae bacterium]|nr:hypothetical protein [Lachnospiraceae bacterium]
MPQINKIRIVNLNYNDGNRFIPDELYDLSSSGTGEALNTLFNLYNGGGKTVLVQLIMQPVHPKAMAGGRHIEEYFSHTGDHSFILLEWNLDGSKEKLLTGIAIAAGSSASTEENQRGNSIKYYTFTTRYETYSAYSIASLDLSANENGNYVPARFEYVRERAKTSRGALEYFSSDDAVKWADYLAEYGIYRTEWESVIEVLNKDEGGLDKYFDEAKTSDKLIAKFFIPAIEQKLMSSASKGTDSSLETMLINYAKKITDKESVIRQRDVNKKLLDDLETVSGISDELYNANDRLVTNVSETRGFVLSLSKRINAVNTDMDGIDREAEKQKGLIHHIEYEDKSKKYYDAVDRQDKARNAMEEAQELLDRSKAELEEKKHEEDILHCAKLYRQIQEADGKIIEIKKLIEDRENNSKDAERIANLKYSAFVKAEEAKKGQENRKKEIEENIEHESENVKVCKEVRIKAEAVYESARDRYNRASTRLEEAKGNTDKRIRSLQIEAQRKLTGFYAEDETEAERAQREEERKELENDLIEIENSIAEKNKRMLLIPQETAELMIRHNDVFRSLEEAESRIEEYNSAFEQITQICEKYSYENTAAFNGVLCDAIRRDIETAEAEITTGKRRLDSLNEKKKAAEAGYLHILPEIMNYVNSTGLNPTTGEEYICGLIEAGTISTERAEEILNACPEMAYALLFDNEKGIQRLLSAGNADWLPAVVPLFTMEQVDRIFNGTNESGAFLTAYDTEFFANREDYVSSISGDILNLEESLKQSRDHLREAKSEQLTADNFKYDENWSKEQEDQIEGFKAKLREIESKKEELDHEQINLKEEINKLKEKQTKCNGLIQKTDKWLDLFAELIEMLSEEQEKYREVQDAYKEKSVAEADHKNACDDLEKHNTELASLKDEAVNIGGLLDKIRTVLENVNNAKAAELIEGEYEILFTQYKEHLRNMDESLEGLRNTLETERRIKQKSEDELAGYTCEDSEYTDPSLSTEALPQVRQQREACEKARDLRQSEYTDKNGEFKASDQALKHAEGALSEHDGVPLPKDEIGESFEERMFKAREEIKSLSGKHNELETEKRFLEKISDQVNNILEEYPVGIAVEGVSLSEKPDEQWKELREKLNSGRNVFFGKKNELSRRIQVTVAAYKDIALAEIVSKLDAIAGMLDNEEIRGDRLFTISESITAMIESISKINSKIETDLKEITNDFNDLVNQCFLQGKRVYEDLRMIAGSSKAHIYEGKPQTPMLKIELPEEKELSEEASEVSIRNEIEKGANEIKRMLIDNQEEKQIRKRAKSIVSSERLLHRYITKETVPVKVFKIDLNSANSSYKRWEDTLTQSSGAEKFVVFFSVVLTLMNYTRSVSGVVSRDVRSVLILDNPFGKITSAHLLKPMFDIAKHFNVQLICFSDINKSDVISCFACVIKLVIKQQNLSSFEIMTHEGNEKIEHGYYKIMNGQMSLF